MKVVHCLGWYLPDSAGGTEAYVRRLALEQQAQGLSVTVLAARDGEQAERYRHDGIDVFRYPVPQERTVAQHQGRGPHARFETFRDALADLAPDVFHIHSQTYGCGPAHLEAACEGGAVSVITAHVPGFVCMRGTMMRGGKEACDGRMDPGQCVPCWLETRGMPAALGGPVAQVAGALPAAITRRAPGRARAVLEAPARVRAQREAMLRMVNRADRTVVVCRWLHEALRENGAPAERMEVCRQAVESVLPAGERGPRPRDGGPRLRLGFFGRGHPVKGVDLLVRAVQQLPRDSDVELRVYALSHGEEERRHMVGVRELAAGDPRVQLLPPLAPDAVPSAMRDCDVIAVPSRWLETGPMVAMDALAVGVPVLGSDLGGLSELVEHGVTGWLEPADDLVRWGDRIAGLTRPGAAALRWDAKRPGLQTWKELAEHTLAMYRRLR